MHGWQSELMDRKVVEALNLSLSSCLICLYLAACLFVYLSGYLS